MDKALIVIFSFSTPNSFVVICFKRTNTPQSFLYLRETKSWWCGEGEEEEKGEEEEGENVYLLTHPTARGVGKNKLVVPSLRLHHIFYVSTIHHGSNRRQDNNAAMNQNCCCSVTFFTSTSNINYSVIFYARTLFKTSHIFLEFPHKGILNK